MALPLTTLLASGLIVGVVLMAVVHTASRVGGAMLGAVWAVGVAVLGLVSMSGGNHTIEFLRIQFPLWLHFVIAGCLFVWHTSFVARAWRRRRSTA
jgi:hypothetical protein